MADRKARYHVGSAHQSSLRIEVLFGIWRCRRVDGCCQSIDYWHQCFMSPGMLVIT